MGFKSVLKAAFPFLAAAATAGGPLATMAAGMVGKAIGVDKVEPTEEGIADAITKAQARDPEALFKIQQAEQEFQVKMTALGFDSLEKLDRISADDRASARAREIAVRDATPSRLSYIDTIAFVAAFVVLLLVPVPSAMHDLLLIMVTTLANNLINGRSYYFGSSSGSVEKTKTIANMANGNENK